MKKSLIALAVASAVSAPAFAATSNVDIYGKLHASMNIYSDLCENTAECTENPAASTTSGGMNDFSLSSNSSRIGFKGTEDLGGGLAAIWQIESGVTLDEQGGTWAGRNSFVGVKGGFGTVLAGTHDTPLKLVGRAVDLFGDTIADSRNLMAGGSDTRAKNTIAYISPDMSGFGIAVAYAGDLTAKGSDYDSMVGSVTAAVSDGKDNDAYNLNATYTNGPLFLGAAYGDGDAHDALGVGAHYRLAGGYTFGNFKVVGQYDNLEDAVTGDTRDQGDFDAWMVGASYTMGAMVFKANYMDGEYDGDTAADGYDVEQWTVGMDYNLSKRTSVYALYVDGSNIAVGTQTSDVAYGNLLSTGDVDVSAFSLGVVHSF